MDKTQLSMRCESSASSLFQLDWDSLCCLPLSDPAASFLAFSFSFHSECETCFFDLCEQQTKQRDRRARFSFCDRSCIATVTRPPQRQRRGRQMHPRLPLLSPKRWQCHCICPCLQFALACLIKVTVTLVTVLVTFPLFLSTCSPN